MQDVHETVELDRARSFSVMVERVKDYAIFLMDPAGIIRTWNPAAVAMKGYSSEEAIGTFFGSLYTEEDQASGHPKHNLETAAEQGTFQEEAWRRKKDGSLFWALVEIIAIRDEQGGLAGFCKVTRDLSDHHALIRQLAQERQRAQVTLGAISDAVISMDSSGQIDYLNEKAEELTGWRAAEAKGRLLPEVVDLRATDAGTHGPDRLPAAHPGPPSAALLMSKEGRSREVEHAGADIRLQDGSSAGSVMVVRDITHVRSIEKDLKHADRRKDEFLAMLAHELRNPLAPISAAAQLLAMGRMEAAGVQRTSEVIGRQVRHMTGLIDDLLDVSRVTRGLVVLDKHKLDLKSVIAEALEQARPLIEGRSHHMTLDLAPGEAFIQGDKKRLVQVITNLLANAAKYTRPGGHIQLSMDVHAEHVGVCVKDDGIGMSAEMLDRAFQMFAQAERTPDRAQGGLGLGLALVRSLVELHDGSVTAESDGPDRGSKFTVVLPRLLQSGPSREWSEAPDAPASSTKSRLRVLIVDDNVDAALLLGEYLVAVGHDVAVEHQALAALALAEKFMPHVCLFDIGLPDLDGLELARRLRRRLPHATFVAVTGYGQQQDVASALDAGYDHHLVKPVDTHQLLALLDAAGTRMPESSSPGPV